MQVNRRKIKGETSHKGRDKRGQGRGERQRTKIEKEWKRRESSGYTGEEGLKEEKNEE